MRPPRNQSRSFPDRVRARTDGSVFGDEAAATLSRRETETQLRHRCRVNAGCRRVPFDTGALPPARTAEDPSRRVVDPVPTELVNLERVGLAGAWPQPGGRDT